jgi:hypothetical protein
MSNKHPHASEKDIALASVPPGLAAAPAKPAKKFYRPTHHTMVDPHSKVKFLAGRGTPSELTNWVKAQVGAKLLVEVSE